MPHYRLNILDKRGGLMGAVDFECTDDEAANGRAETVLEGDQRGELWRRIISTSAADRNGHVREPH